jgi:rod shape-determining protein MreD
VSIYLAVPLLTLVGLIQNALLSRLSLFGSRPDLMLLVVLGWTIVRGANEGLVWAFIGGLVLDLLSGGPIGAYILALLGVAFVGHQAWGEGLGTPLVRVLLLALVSALVYHIIILVVLTWTGHVVDWSYAFLRVAGPSVVLAVIMAPFVQRALAWLAARMELRGRIR